MKRLPLALIVFVIGILVGVGQIVTQGPLLPAKVASHFGIDGRADGFMTRDSFLLSQWIMIGCIAALFFGLATMFRFFPSDRTEPDDKLHGLSPEQRAAALAFLSDRMYVFGSATLALMIGVFQLMFDANVRGTLRMPSTIWIMLAAYLLYVGVWSLSLVRRFQTPSDR